MDQRLAKAAVDAAEWDTKIGVIVGGFVALLRLVALVGFIAADGDKDWLLGGEIALQAILAATFSVGVWQRRVGAAIALAVLYGLGYFYSWYISDRVLPPLGLIGLAIWYGLYRGIRGTRWLAAQQGQSQVPAL